MTVPSQRVSSVNDAPVRADGAHVLYWMIAQRRTEWNFGLQQAVVRARELNLPLIVLEALRCDYRWASDRLHRFVLDGMADNAARFEKAGVAYHPYVERRVGEGRGLLPALAKNAAVVVTDEFPCFFLPSMVAAAGKQLPVRLEQVDGNGLLPLRATDHDFPTAYAFRRALQKTLPRHLADFPERDPLARIQGNKRATIPSAVTSRWPAVPQSVLEATDAAWLADLPIDHTVKIVSERGGSQTASRIIDRFLEGRLRRYADDRNQPEQEVASGLSPWLHFGHASVHDVVTRLIAHEEWSSDRLGKKTDGSRAGWWGMSVPAESFLDELITWRELGYVFCHHRPDYAEYGSLPAWARTTLAEHATDHRDPVYDLAEFEAAATHDDLWNAAQCQLRSEGRIHNYLRMLWGKKILHWSRSPEEALSILIELNNKYALDGRNPNSYSGIFWTLGRFDRAWGPEREIFGKIRYMTSENTARKVRVRDYVERHLRPGLFG